MAGRPCESALFRSELVGAILTRPLAADRSIVTPTQTIPGTESDVAFFGTLPEGLPAEFTPSLILAMLDAGEGQGDTKSGK